jgi:hypothetical protein
LVIANKAVAQSYLVIADILGVDINLSKSMIAEDTPAFEFAKRIFRDTIDVSPGSPRLLAHVTRNIGYLPTVIRDLLSRGACINPVDKFFAGSPLQKVVRLRQSLKWEVMNLLPFEASTSTLAPFLETNQIDEDKLIALLTSFDQYINHMLSKAFWHSLRKDKKLLEDVTKVFGSTVGYFQGPIGTDLDFPRLETAFSKLPSSANIR